MASQVAVAAAQVGHACKEKSLGEPQDTAAGTAGGMVASDPGPLAKKARLTESGLPPDDAIVDATSLLRDIVSEAAQREQSNVNCQLVVSQREGEDNRRAQRL
jgi:hypothetical protein